MEAEVSVRELRRVLLFGLVAGTGTALDLTAALLLLRAGVPVVLGVAVGWSCNVGSGYVLNRRVVFPDGTATVASSARRYAYLVALNALVGVGGVSLAVELGTPYVLARVVSSILLVLTNLVLSRYWVFRVPRQGAPAAGAGD
ncbi:MAG: hypothetical protein JWO60_905 [Frankiales bacterium]|nr:hypothetical protein [Frankiales bacterium]